MLHMADFIQALREVAAERVDLFVILYEETCPLKTGNAEIREGLPPPSSSG